jgi:hypothetical protein
VCLHLRGRIAAILACSINHASAWLQPLGLWRQTPLLLKEAYLLAANLAGGEEGLVGYLKTQALQGNPSPFMAGLAKLLPLMLEGSKDAPLKHEVIMKFI